VVGEGFEPPKAEPAELQSDPFGRLGNPPDAFHTKVILDEARNCQSYNTLAGLGDPPLNWADG
jgi:hypothetical protein